MSNLKCYAFRLLGEGVNASFDKKTIKRLQDIEQLDEDTKNHPL